MEIFIELVLVVIITVVAYITGKVKGNSEEQERRKFLLGGLKVRIKELQEDIIILRTPKKVVTKKKQAVTKKKK